MSKTLAAIEVTLQLGQQQQQQEGERVGKSEIGFASTQTDPPTPVTTASEEIINDVLEEEKKKEVETEVVKIPAVVTEEKEVQTECLHDDEAEQPHIVRVVEDDGEVAKKSVEEKEIQTTFEENEKLSTPLTDATCQTEEEESIKAPPMSDEGICQPPDTVEGEGGRTSACTQTLLEGVCEVEVQTDEFFRNDIEGGGDGQSDPGSRAGQRPPTYPGSPGDELVRSTFENQTCFVVLQNECNEDI